MDLTYLDFVQQAKIQILIVNIGCKDEIWQKYLDEFLKIRQIALMDLPPPVSKELTSSFNDSTMTLGTCLFLNFVESPLDANRFQDMDMSKRVFGIVGITQCQEVDFSQAVLQMRNVTQQNPTALSTRCFAFEPNQSTPDTTPGIIVIPNVGDISFYIQQQLCDMCSEVITGFQKLKGSFDVKQSIPTPDAFPNPVKPSIIGETMLDVKPVDLTENGKKKCQGRQAKIGGDLLLLAGRWIDALQYYQTAMDTLKPLMDWQWWAQAMEGACCAQMLLLVQRGGLAGTQAPPPVVKSPTSILKREQYPTLNSFLADVPSTYRDVVTLLEKIAPGQTQRSTSPLNSRPASPNFEMTSGMGGWMSKAPQLTSNPSAWSNPSEPVFPTHVVLPVQACLRMACLLLNLLSKNVRMGFQGGAWWYQTNPGTFNVSQIQLPGLNDAESGPTKTDVATWLERAWTLVFYNPKRISPGIKLEIASTIASAYFCMGMKRKSAFYLKMLLSILLDNLNATTDVKLAQQLKSSFQTLESTFDLMSRETNVYSKKSNNVWDDREDYGYVVNDDPPLMYHGRLVTTRATDHVRLDALPGRFGWPDLEIDVLQLGIALSHGMTNVLEQIKLSSLLIRRLHPWLTIGEQQKLLDDLSQVPKPYPGHLGAPLVTRLVLERPIEALEVTKHVRKVDKAEDDDPFIYNPFGGGEKKTNDVILTVNDPAYFLIALSNPYSVDLVLESVTLATKGAEFESNRQAILVVGHARKQLVMLTGTPKEPGEVTFLGIKVSNGNMSEVLVPLSEERDVGSNTPTLFIPPQDVVDGDRLYGRKELHFKKEDGGVKSFALQTWNGMELGQGSTSWSKTYQVIPRQPLMEISLTSTSGQAAINKNGMEVVLNVGEYLDCELILKNVGDEVIDHVVVNFHESYTLPQISRDVAEAPEVIYEREVYQKSLAGIWISGNDKKHRIVLQLKEPLGHELRLPLKMMGKHGLNKVMIVVDYGHATSGDQYYTRRVEYPITCNIVDQVKVLGLERMGEVDATTGLFSVNVSNDLPTECQITVNVDETNTLDLPSGKSGNIQAKLARFDLPRQDALKPIPSPPNQFIVTRVLQFDEEERKLRSMLFWYKQALTEKIKVSWKSGDRRGVLNLRPALQNMNNASLEWIRPYCLKVSPHQDIVEAKVGQQVTLKWMVVNHAEDFRIKCSQRIKGEGKWVIQGGVDKIMNLKREAFFGCNVIFLSPGRYKVLGVVGILSLGESHGREFESPLTCIVE